MVEKLKKAFAERYTETPFIFRSPGRVNILGEHTDYNEGFVLPAAIDKNIYIAIAKTTGTQITLYSMEYQESFTADLGEINIADKHWPNYLLGVVDQLQKRGAALTGFNLAIDGDIPIGSGLSSSAAVECAMAFALNDLFDLDLDKLTMVKLAQKAEHVFAGVNCGIMDQFASMFGKKDHVIKLDCRSLEYEYVPLKLNGYKILLLNSNVKHKLASTEYNTRRQQCEKGIELIAPHHPEVKSLRDVSMEMLKKYVEPADPLVFLRCKFIIEENERLLVACEDLRKADIKALGIKMFKTHRGLSYLYEVSCPELDFLVDYVKRIPAVAGARMMGGGFGGCTINLVEEEMVEKIIGEISEAYYEAMNLPLTTYIASIENGTEACK